MVFSGRHPRYVQHSHQFAVRVKNRGARATEPRMPAPKMLIAVHQHRPLLGDAGADAVGSFGFLRPHAAQPDAPVLELTGFGFFSAIMNGLLAPPLILLVILLTSSRKVMGQRTNSPLLKSLGWVTFAIMTAAAVGMLITG